MKCHYCSKAFDDPDDLRPYGPGGAMICFPCGTATPERFAETERNLKALMTRVLETAEKTGAPMLLGEGSPRTGSPGTETMQ